MQRPGPCLSWDGSAPLNTIEGLKPLCQGFSGGPAVKSPAASAGDLGSVPDQGAPHKLRNSSACRPQLFSLLCSRAQGAAGTEDPEPVFRNKRSHRNEKPTGHHWRLAPARPS